MKYEICNPSDPYTMDCPDIKLATAAILLLGSGHYPLVDIETQETIVPVFMFGGLEEWLTEHFGSESNFSDFVKSNKPAIADCLASVTLGCAERSSMNDIGGRAHKMADELRQESKEEVTHGS
jgi:hypothetical protein